MADNMLCREVQAAGRHKATAGKMVGYPLNSPPQHGCCAKTMPLTGRLTERVSYGNQYKPISRINSSIFGAIQYNVEQLPGAIIVRLEGHFAVG